MIIKEPTFKILRSSDPEFKSGCFVVVDPLVFRWEAKRCNIKIEQGAHTNFASIPSGFRNLFPVNGRHRLAAVAHDYLYWLGGAIAKDQENVFAQKSYQKVNKLIVFYSRKEADQIFYDLMLHEGVKKWRAKMMFLAVRVFGKSHWGIK